MVTANALILVIFVAIVSSVHPGFIGTTTSLFSTFLGKGGSNGRFVRLGLAYFTGFFVVLTMIGLGLVWAVGELSWQTHNFLLIILSTVVAAAGILEIKDFFWYGKGASMRLPSKTARLLHSRAIAKDTPLAAFGLGGLFSVLSLPYASIPYLALLLVLEMELTTSSAFLVELYSLLFMIPVITILALVAGKTKITAIARWKEARKSEMRLASGLLLVGLSWLMLLSASGAIDIGSSL